MTFSDIERNSFEVDITPQKGHPAVERYEAAATGARSYSRSCAARASASPLYCWMSGLSPSIEYTVSVKACLPGRVGCGPAFVRKVRTGIDSFLHTSKKVKVIINPLSFLRLAG